MAESASRVRYEHRAMLSGALFVILGIVLFVISLEMHEGVISDGARELATIFMLGGALHVAYEKYLREDFMRVNDENRTAIVSVIGSAQTSILEQLQVAKQADLIGLADIRSDAGTCDYATMLERSRRVTIVLNDGVTWVANNADRLRKRFRDLSKETTIILLHPSSGMLKILAEKEGADQGAFTLKLSETVRTLGQLRLPETDLRILGHMFFNPQSVYLGDDYVIISPEFHTVGRRTVPAYRFNKRDAECYYNEVAADIQALQSGSVDISWLQVTVPPMNVHDPRNATEEPLPAR